MTIPKAEARKARPRTAFRALDGIVLLDKPEGLSSNQALQRVRHLLRAAKGGHTGALDPLATGMLPLCFGEATKLAGVLLGSRKAYRAELRLGVTTATGDREGEVSRRREVPALDAPMLERALARFRGRIMQTPPVYSALKQGGEPLYAKARRGEAVAVAAREVCIDRLDLLGFDRDSVQLDITCGSGTYIRSLAVDLGEALGCGAHLTALRRLWVEPFAAQPMHALQAFADAAARGDSAWASWLMPLESGAAALPRVDLDAAHAAALGQGRPIKLPVRGAEEICAAFGPDGRLLALGAIDAAGVLHARRGFAIPAATRQTAMPSESGTDDGLVAADPGPLQ